MITGDRLEAVRSYQHYLRLRADPESWLKPQADYVAIDPSRLVTGSE